MNKVKNFKHCFIFCFALCLFFSFFITKASANEATLIDDALLFDSDEVDQITASIDKIAKNNNVDIYLLTEVGSGSADWETTAKSYATQAGLSNGLLIYVNMNESNRGLWLLSYGDSKAYLSQGRLETLSDSLRSSFKSGDYYEGISSALLDIEDYFKKEASKDGLFYQIWFQLIIAVVIGIVVVLAMAIRSGGKVTTSQDTYLDHQTSRVLGGYEHFIRKTVTRTKKDHDSNSSGSGSSNSAGGGF